MLPSEKKAKMKQKDRDYLKRPGSTQELIPIDAAYENGMFLSNGSIYSKCFRFSDVNYTIAEQTEQEDLIRSLRSILKSCTPAEISQITIVNRHINEDVLSRLRYAPCADGMDDIRQELNQLIEDQAGRGSGIIQERYFTCSVEKPSPKAAAAHFDRVGTELSLRFAGMGSHFAPMELPERLRLLHDFYRPGDENYWQFDFEDKKSKNHSVKDSIAPMSLTVKKDHIEMAGKFLRVLAMTEYANYIDDSTLSKLAALDTEMIISVSFLPLPTDEAVKFFQQKLDSVEANSLRNQQKQLQRNQFHTQEPYQYKKTRANIQDILNDITARDCGLMIATITVCHLADTKEKLDSDTELIRTVARDVNCELNVCTSQQLEALNTALPFGLDRIYMDRSLTSEALAAFVPFNAQEICDPSGVLYGQNAITRNLVVVDRLAKSSGNGFILGQTGGGKSFFCKNEIISLRLRYPADKADFLILDPENEYATIVKELGGEIYHIGKDSINLFDLEIDVSEKKPLAYKTEFITTCCERIADGKLDAQTKSLVDRAVRNTYREFLEKKGNAPMPLMADFKMELDKVNHRKANDLSLALERFVDGYLNSFAAPTNINSDNSLICYSLNGLQDQMKSLGTIITLDHLLNRVMRNYRQGKITFVYADEFSLLFQTEETGVFFSNLWRRIRKYNGFCTGATQNVEEVLESESGRSMLSLSDFVVMLNQSPTNAEQLSQLYKISPNQEVYFRNVQPGHGLLKVGGALVPFVSSVPKDTRLYSLMSTNPREGKWN